MAPQNRGESVLQVTNVTSLGNTKKKKSLALRFLFCYSGSFIDSTNVCQIQSLFVDGKSRKCDPSRPRQRGTTRENSYSSSPSLSCFLGEKKGQRTTIQPCTHRPQKEREMARQRGSLLSECLIHLALAENRHFNMTSIRVSFST